ncbi:hypothetical protein [Paraflavitalea speifideaquila]|uniref:hypothetical protein n=1 Tax=Paraflavitalea speifideaquila TaxID=3076558 RepID=UPI0028E4E4A9|nr:hypothetical protein [Paraflavitalea speifideiaquila]
MKHKPGELSAYLDRLNRAMIHISAKVTPLIVIGAIGLCNPAVGIPLALSYLTGIPVLPAPQAMTGSAGVRAAIEMEEALAESPAIENAGRAMQQEAKATSTINNVQRQAAAANSKTAIRKEYAQSVFKAAGKSDRDVNNLMNTIDYNKTVKEIVLNPGDKVWKFERSRRGIEPEKHFLQMLMVLMLGRQALALEIFQDIN